MSCFIEEKQEEDEGDGDTAAVRYHCRHLVQHSNLWIPNPGEGNPNQKGFYIITHFQEVDALMMEQDIIECVLWLWDGNSLLFALGQPSSTQCQKWRLFSLWGYYGYKCYKHLCVNIYTYIFIYENNIFIIYTIYNFSWINM